MNSRHLALFPSLVSPFPWMRRRNYRLVRAFAAVSLQERYEWLFRYDVLQGTIYFSFRPKVPGILRPDLRRLQQLAGLRYVRYVP